MKQNYSAQDFADDFFTMSPSSNAALESRGTLTHCLSCGQKIVEGAEVKIQLVGGDEPQAIMKLHRACPTPAMSKFGHDESHIILIGETAEQRQEQIQIIRACFVTFNEKSLSQADAEFVLNIQQRIGVR